MPESKANKSEVSNIGLDISQIIRTVIESSALKEAITEAIQIAVAEVVTAEIRKVAQPLEDKIKALSDELERIKEETATHQDNAEQYSRRNNLRIFGIPEIEGKDTDEIVRNITQEKLKVDLPEYAICQSHRVGKKTTDKPRPIIVKFISHNIRHSVFMKKKALKGTKIKITEDLIKHRLDIYNAAFQKFEMNRV